MTNVAPEDCESVPRSLIYPPVDEIIEAALKVFESRGYQQGLRRLTLTQENLASGNDVYTTIRPYSIYRDVIAALCFEHDDTNLQIYARLPGNPTPRAAAERAKRQIATGNADYVWLDSKLRQILYPIETNLKAAEEIAAKEAQPAETDKADRKPANTPPADNTGSHTSSTQGAGTHMTGEPADGSDTADATSADTSADAQAAQEPTGSRKPLSIDLIKRACVAAWNETFPQERVNKTLIDSGARPRHVTQPRQLSMYMSICLITERERGSLPSVGRQHGGRDHTTALHSFRKVGEQIKNKDEVTLTLIQKVSERLQCTEEEMEIILNPVMNTADIRRPSATESPTAP